MTHDFYVAYIENDESLRKFKNSDVYKTWIAGNPMRNEKMLQFQAKANAWCGRKDLHENAFYGSQMPLKDFQKLYCPDKMDHTNYNLPEWQMV